MTPDFKPSDVRLDAIPLINAFGRAECECAAALLVRACVLHGDVWAAQSFDAIRGAFDADVAAKISPIYHIASNPFLQPDFWSLVAKGFATWTDDRPPIQFTAKGFERLKLFVGGSQ